MATSFSNGLWLALAALAPSMPDPPRTSVAPDPANTSSLWKQYREARLAGSEPTLPDFSRAGYHQGDDPLPSPSWKVFDVTAMGAVPDDGESDRAAILAAIAAAEKHGSGIVSFPVGRFRIHEPTDTGNEPLRIRGSRIVLRGSGSGPDGTELFVNAHLEPTDPKKIWSSPYAVEFQGHGRTKVETPVVGDARRETRTVTVEDTALFEPGDWVLLHVLDDSTEAVAAAVAPYEPDPAWKTLVESGVRVDELHQIEAIDGPRLTFAEPMHVDVDASRDWTVVGYDPLQEVGVEQLAFVGNWRDRFRHHRSFLDDGGWSGLSFSKCVNGWIRDCRFTDWSRAVSIKASAAVTASDLVLDGNEGHNAITVNDSSHVLVRDVADTAGHHHASGVAGKSSGNVFLRCEYRADTCFEAHASQPRCTLLDSVSGGWDHARWGGAIANQPNHLRHLVLWNYEHTGKHRRGAFHFMQPRSEYGRIIMPIVVGFHGTPQEFDESQVEVLESNGAAVQPASLYEAQFELRTGRRPSK